MKKSWCLKSTGPLLICLVAAALVFQPGRLQAVALVEAELNRWYDARLPSVPVDHAAMPELFRQFVRSTEPYVVIYRYTLSKGAWYTFQSEYPGDHLDGSLCLRGLNPLSESSSYSQPEGTTPLILCRHRVFPGGNIKGCTYGRKENFRVSTLSDHNYAWLVFTASKPNTPFRFRMISPPEPDALIKKSGGYRIYPDGRLETSWSNVRSEHLWLGYTRGEKEKLAAKHEGGQAEALNHSQPSPRNLSRATGARGEGTATATLQLERRQYRPGESIKIAFTAPATFADNAWIGIIPSSVQHGSETENDQHDIAYAYIHKKTGGEVVLKAPLEPGRYDIRMHDTDSNGREVTSLSFEVVTAAATAANTGIVLGTEITSVAAHQPVLVHFKGLPGNSQDWITVVAAGTPADKYGQWFYTNGRREGQMSFKGLPPGSYEVRAYLNWPAGGYKIAAQHAFDVNQNAGVTTEKAAGATAIVVTPRQNVWVEAEDDTAFQVATRNSDEHRSYPHYGAAYWYLATGGDWIEYTLEVREGGAYSLWVRDFDDQKHDPALRSIRVALDGRDITSLPAHTRTGPDLWDWSRVARVELPAGLHTLRLTKERTTSAAALIDVVFISADDTLRPSAPDQPATIGTAPHGNPTPGPAEPQAVTESARNFLKAVASNDADAVLSLTSKEFQASWTPRLFNDFRQSLLNFGPYEEAGNAENAIETGREVLLALKNQQNQKIMVHFVFVQDQIDQCIARWGIQ